MIYLLRFRRARVSTMLFLLLFGTSLAFGQIGGPYTPDANTMLLLHFDNDYTNASQYSLNAVTHGNPSNFFFLANPVPNLGQCLRIDNDSQSDSAYVTVADTSYLDLTADWTIEGWINIFTFGTGSSDWRWVPRLVIKTGDAVFWRPNYFVEMWGSTRLFSCGYQAASEDQWPQSNSAANVMEVGTWYHMAFIRDTNTHLLMTIINKWNTATSQIELVSFTTADYLSFGAANPTPIVTNMPVHIGYAGGGGDSFLDGFVDEIRISDVVREYPIPPVISNVSVLSNQTTSVPQYEVGAHVFTVFPSTSVSRAELFYSLDGGSSYTPVTMTTVSGDSMVGAIPQQPLGSVIQYYLEAEDNDGRIFQYPQNAGWQNADYLSFGVYEENTQTLALTFEEGSGAFQDTSGYAQDVDTYGNPTHSSSAAVGNYSVYLEGDSSLLEVDSPFLAATEYFVDFWFYPEAEMGTRDYCRIFNRPRDAASWSANNYQVRFNPAGNNTRRMYAGADGQFTITFEDSIDMEQWYHVQLEVRAAPPGDTVNYYAIFRLAGANDNTLEQKYVGFDDEVVPGFAPLRIGKAADPTPGVYPPFFKGHFDNILVYNYPAGQLDLVNVVGIEDGYQNVALTYELSQNYPNPFNPNTEIRFRLAKSEKVELVVFDILGRKVATILNATANAGKHVALWNGRDDFGYPVASGVYIYRLQTKNFVQSKKMILMK